MKRKFDLQKPHHSVPSYTGVAYFGWFSCQRCQFQRWSRDERYLGSPSTKARFTNEVWVYMKRWHERTYKEMWEDFKRETQSR